MLLCQMLACFSALLLPSTMLLDSGSYPTSSHTCLNWALLAGCSTSHVSLMSQSTPS